MPAEVHTIHIGGVCAFLIETESGLVLVDAGWPRTEQPILRRMRALGRSDLRLIFITHAHLDHYGSAAALRRLTGAPIAIHRADAEFMARGETPVRSARSWGRLGRWFLRVGHGRAWVEPASADVLLDDGDALRAWAGRAGGTHARPHAGLMQPVGGAAAALRGRSALHQRPAARAAPVRLRLVADALQPGARPGPAARLGLPGSRPATSAGWCVPGGAGGVRLADRD